MDEARLTILARDDLRWIVERLALRVARGQFLESPLTLTRATPAQRRAIDDLLGRRASQGTTLTVTTDQLRAALDAPSLEAIARQCCPDAYTEAATRAESITGWNRVLQNARTSLADSPPLTAWLDRLASDGLLKRLSGRSPAAAESLLDRAIAVLRTHPARETLLAELAATITGDSHALDVGQPLATLCLRAIRELHGIDGLASASARREAWASVGVALDDLSAPALAFNLAARPGSRLAEILDAHRAAALPAWISLRHLRRAGEDFAPLPAAMKTIFVCENPSIVSRAATELGPACRPLVCTNGQPSTAVRQLLRRLREAGADLHVHADFDWAGLRIADQLVREFQAVPWRMTVEAYESVPASVNLAGGPSFPSWAKALATAMKQRARAIFEEQVSDPLIADLRDGAIRRSPSAAAAGRSGSRRPS